MMKQSLAVAGALLITLMASSAARAQDPLDSLSVRLRPVVVNVLRTPFTVTSAPFAVAANDQDEVQRGRPGLGLEEALGGIPGLQVDDRYNYALGDRVSIRGFGARTQFGIRGVKILVDGIPATLPDGQSNLNHLDLSFLRRAEVIRGPASSLYGNAAGGVIQFETQTPPLVPISQEFGIVAGDNGLLRMHSTTGGTVGNAGYLLNIAHLKFDGYRDFQDAENLQLNGSVATQALGGALRLQGSYVDYDANNPGSLSLPLLEADRNQAFATNVQRKTGEDGTQGQGGLSWSSAVAGGLLEVAGYGIMREIVNPIPATIIDLERRAGGVRALFHSSAVPDAPGINWTVGAEGDLQSDDRKNFVNNNGERAALTLDQDETVTAGSAFGQLTGSMDNGLTAIAGLRYDHTRFKAEDRLISGTTNPDDSGSRSMNAVSPSLGLSFMVVPEATIYGNVATSFETPTTTELANQSSGAGGFNPDLEPQKALSFEVGAKGMVAGIAAYQLAAYRAEITNSLIPFEVPGSVGRSFFRNAGSSVHQGVEAGLTVVPVNGFRMNVAYTYLDARFDEYTVGTTDLHDKMVPGVSPHRLDASVGADLPYGLFANVNARYVDELPVNDANTVTSPAYTVVDVRAGLSEFRLTNLVIEPFAGITNLFNEKYNSSVTVNAFGNPGRYFEPGPGQSFYFGGQIRFEAN